MLGVPSPFAALKNVSRAGEWLSLTSLHRRKIKMQDVEVTPILVYVWHGSSNQSSNRGWHEWTPNQLLNLEKRIRAHIPANEVQIWIAQIEELQKSFTMIPNSNQFSGSCKTKILSLQFELNISVGLRFLIFLNESEFGLAIYELYPTQLQISSIIWRLL